MTSRRYWLALGVWLMGCGGSQKSPESPGYPQGQPGYGQPGYGQQPEAAPLPGSGQPADAAPEGAAAPSSLEPPRYAEPPPPDTLEQAEAELERARAELELATGSPPAADRAARKSGGAPAKAAKPATASCNNLCRSFSSLKRAASAVCRLAGDPSARCSRAKTLVDENERRIASCRCGAEDAD